MDSSRAGSDAATARGSRCTAQARPTQGIPLEAPTGIAPESAIERGSGDVGDPGGDPHGVPFSLGDNVSIGDPPPPPPLPPPPPKTPVPVGGSILPPQKIRNVDPVYPVLAQKSGVEGIVILEAVLGEDGRVRSLRVLRSKPLLDQAAIEAVRQWLFTPTLLNGQPVPVVMTVTVQFTLRH